MRAAAVGKYLPAMGLPPIRSSLLPSLPPSLPPFLPVDAEMEKSVVVVTSAKPAAVASRGRVCVGV